MNELIKDWLDEEEPYRYKEKWGPQAQDDALIDGSPLGEPGVGKNSHAYNGVTQYMHRAEVLGLGTLAGRQALMKALGTMIGVVESMYRVYGLPPQGGLPSGDLGGKADAG